MVEGVASEGEKGLDAEKPSGEEDAAADGDKEAAKNEVEEKEPEDKVKEQIRLYMLLPSILIEFLSGPCNCSCFHFI